MALKDQTTDSQELLVDATTNVSADEADDRPSDATSERSKAGEGDNEIEKEAIA